MAALTTILLLALIIGSVSFTISVTGIFKWLRELVSPIHHKIEELVHCPYCLSHWLTFLLLFIYPGFIQKFTPFIVLNFLLTTFAIVGIVGLLHYVYLRAYEPVAKAMAQRQIDKLKKLRQTQN